MIILHSNRNQTYELYEEGNTVFIKGDQLRVQGKEDLHTAIWHLLDWIRTISFTNISEADCKTIQVISRSDKQLNTEEVMNAICGKKINRLFYEHAYDLLYHTQTTKADKFVILNNEHNFFIYEEIIQLLKFSTLKDVPKIRSRK